MLTNTFLGSKILVSFERGNNKFGKRLTYRQDGEKDEVRDMKFTMVRKGYEYVTEDGAIKIERQDTFKRVGFGLVPTFHWAVYGLEEKMVYQVPSLNRAKSLVRERLGK